jgi:hypothetical protein
MPRIFLPPTRAPSCSYEYRTLVRAFHKEIIPHIDQEMAKQVLDTNWLPDPESNAVPNRVAYAGYFAMPRFNFASRL